MTIVFTSQGRLHRKLQCGFSDYFLLMSHSDKTGILEESLFYRVAALHASLSIVLYKKWERQIQSIQNLQLCDLFS